MSEIEGLREAIGPLLDAVGASAVPPDSDAADLVLVWPGSAGIGVRLPDLHGALDRLILGVERDLGGTLALLSREDKQNAVRLLDQRGAFTLRKGVEQVADILGVSRFTVYNYLNSSTHGGAR
ncbi:MAG: helix-turn-helix domain-containing protein [Acidimicrobiales bacterium]